MSFRATKVALAQLVELRQLRRYAADMTTNGRLMEWLDAQIAKRRTTAAAVAEAAGIHKSTISKWRNDGQKPGPADVRAIANALNAPVLEAFIAAEFLRTSDTRKVIEVDRPLSDRSDDEPVSMPHMNSRGARSPTPGWYPDPSGASGHRYWDGLKWCLPGHFPKQQAADMAGPQAALAGWYPDPAGGTAQRYWNGRNWTIHRATPQSHPKNVVSLAKIEKIAGALYAFTFGGLASVFAISGEWKAVAGVAILAVLVGAPLILLMLTVRRVRQVRQNRLNRREYEAGLAVRCEREHQAIMRGDVDAGVFGTFQPGLLPDAEQMRQQAWQPDLCDSAPAVRPKNPAPWHIVTQYPTRQLQAPAGSSRAVPGQGECGVSKPELG